MIYSNENKITAVLVLVLAFLSTVLLLLWMLQATDPRVSPGALEPYMQDNSIVTPEPGSDGFRRHEVGKKPQPYRLRKVSGV